MTVGVPTFCGQRLTEARLARGLFKKSLGDLIGITGEAIARYETGQDRPQAARLTALADKLHFPEEFFSRPAWPEEFDVVFWRVQSAETKLAREMTEQRARWIAEIFSFLEQEVNFPAQDLIEPDLPTDFRLITPEIIEKTAETLRSHWNLRDRPIPDVTLALENAGIPVIHLDIPSEKQDGFCFKSTLLARYFVGVNVSQLSAARARYDAAHELGHAVLHKRVTKSHLADKAIYKLIETQAHRFAGAFLFPRDKFMSEVRVPSLDYFCSLKKRWGMSIGSMVYRAHDLGLIDSFEKQTLYANMSRRGWRGVMREPFDAPEDMALERPRMMRRAVEAVVEGNVFGKDSLLSAMPLPEVELEQISGLTRGYFRTAEVVQLPGSARQRELGAVDLETGQVLMFPRRRPT